MPEPNKDYIRLLFDRTGGRGKYGTYKQFHAAISADTEDGAAFRAKFYDNNGGEQILGNVHDFNFSVSGVDTYTPEVKKKEPSGPDAGTPTQLSAADAEHKKIMDEARARDEAQRAQYEQAEQARKDMLAAQGQDITRLFTPEQMAKRQTLHEETQAQQDAARYGESTVPTWQEIEDKGADVAAAEQQKKNEREAVKKIGELKFGIANLEEQRKQMAREGGVPEGVLTQLMATQEEYRRQLVPYYEQLAEGDENMKTFIRGAFQSESPESLEIVERLRSKKALEQHIEDRAAQAEMREREERIETRKEWYVGHDDNVLSWFANTYTHAGGFIGVQLENTWNLFLGDAFDGKLYSDYFSTRLEESKIALMENVGATREQALMSPMELYRAGETRLAAYSGGQEAANMVMLSMAIISTGGSGGAPAATEAASASRLQALASGSRWRLAATDKMAAIRANIIANPYQAGAMYVTGAGMEKASIRARLAAGEDVSMVEQIMGPGVSGAITTLTEMGMIDDLRLIAGTLDKPALDMAKLEFTNGFVRASKITSAYARQGLEMVTDEMAEENFEMAANAVWGLAIGVDKIPEVDEVIEANILTAASVGAPASIRMSKGAASSVIDNQARYAPVTNDRMPTYRKAAEDLALASAGLRVEDISREERQTLERAAEQARQKMTRLRKDSKAEIMELDKEDISELMSMQAQINNKLDDLTKVTSKEADQALTSQLEMLISAKTGLETKAKERVAEKAKAAEAKAPITPDAPMKPVEVTAETTVDDIVGLSSEATPNIIQRKKARNRAGRMLTTVRQYMEMPGMEDVTVRFASEAAIEEVTEGGGYAAWNPDAREITIPISAKKDNVQLHEIMHPMVERLQRTSPEVYQSILDGIQNEAARTEKGVTYGEWVERDYVAPMGKRIAELQAELETVVSPEGKAGIQAEIDQLAKSQEAAREIEPVVEFMADVFAGKFDSKPRQAMRSVVNTVADILRSLGLGKAADSLIQNYSKAPKGKYQLSQMVAELAKTGAITEEQARAFRREEVKATREADKPAWRQQAEEVQAKRREDGKIPTTQKPSEAALPTVEQVAEKIKEGKEMTPEDLQVQANEPDAVEAALQKFADATTELTEEVKKAPPAKKEETPAAEEVAEEPVEDALPEEAVGKIKDVVTAISQAAPKKVRDAAKKLAAGKKVSGLKKSERAQAQALADVMSKESSTKEGLLSVIDALKSLEAMFAEDTPAAKATSKAVKAAKNYAPETGIRRTGRKPKAKTSKAPRLPRAQWIQKTYDEAMEKGNLSSAWKMKQLAHKDGIDIALREGDEAFVEGSKRPTQKSHPKKATAKEQKVQKALDKTAELTKAKERVLEGGKVAQRLTDEIAQQKNKLEAYIEANNKPWVGRTKKKIEALNAELGDVRRQLASARGQKAHLETLISQEAEAKKRGKQALAEQKKRERQQKIDAEVEAAHSNMTLKEIVDFHETGHAKEVAIVMEPDGKTIHAKYDFKAGVKMVPTGDTETRASKIKAIPMPKGISQDLFAHVEGVNQELNEVEEVLTVQKYKTIPMSEAALKRDLTDALIADVAFKETTEYNKLVGLNETIRQIGRIKQQLNSKDPEALKYYNMSQLVEYEATAEAARKEARQELRNKKEELEAQGKNVYRHVHNWLVNDGSAVSLVDTKGKDRRAQVTILPGAMTIKRRDGKTRNFETQEYASKAAFTKAVNALQKQIDKGEYKLVDSQKYSVERKAALKKGTINKKQYERLLEAASASEVKKRRTKQRILADNASRLQMQSILGDLREIQAVPEDIAAIIERSVASAPGQWVSPAYDSDRAAITNYILEGVDLMEPAGVLGRQYIQRTYESLERVILNDVIKKLDANERVAEYAEHLSDAEKILGKPEKFRYSRDEVVDRIDKILPKEIDEDGISKLQKGLTFQDYRLAIEELLTITDVWSPRDIYNAISNDIIYPTKLRPVTQNFVAFTDAFHKADFDAFMSNIDKVADITPEQATEVTEARGPRGLHTMFMYSAKRTTDDSKIGLNKVVDVLTLQNQEVFQAVREAYDYPDVSISRPTTYRLFNDPTLSSISAKHADVFAKRGIREAGLVDEYEALVQEKGRDSAEVEELVARIRMIHEEVASQVSVFIQSAGDAVLDVAILNHYKGDVPAADIVAEEIFTTTPLGTVLADNFLNSAFLPARRQAVFSVHEAHIDQAATMLDEAVSHYLKNTTFRVYEPNASTEVVTDLSEVIYGQEGVNSNVEIILKNMFTKDVADGMEIVLSENKLRDDLFAKQWADETLGAARMNIGLDVVGDVELMLYEDMSATYLEEVVKAAEMMSATDILKNYSPINKRVESLKDLATASSFILSRRAEVATRIFVDAKGNIIDHVTSSSMEPGATSFIHDGSTSTHMRKIGAAGFFDVHNHPGAVPLPSETDLDTFEYTARRNARGYLGALILTEDKFTYTAPSKQAEVGVIQSYEPVKPRAKAPVFTNADSFKHGARQIASSLRGTSNSAVVFGLAKTDGATRVVDYKVIDADLMTVNGATAAIAAFRARFSEQGTSVYVVPPKNATEATKNKYADILTSFNKLENVRNTKALDRLVKMTDVKASESVAERATRAYSEESDAGYAEIVSNEPLSVLSFNYQGKDYSAAEIVDLASKMTYERAAGLLENIPEAGEYIEALKEVTDNISGTIETIVRLSRGDENLQTAEGQSKALDMLLSASRAASVIETQTSAQAKEAAFVAAVSENVVDEIKNSTEISYDPGRIMFSAKRNWDDTTAGQKFAANDKELKKVADAAKRTRGARFRETFIDRKSEVTGFLLDVMKKNTSSQKAQLAYAHMRNMPGTSAWTEHQVNEAYDRVFAGVPANEKTMKDIGNLLVARTIISHDIRRSEKLDAQFKTKDEAMGEYTTFAALERDIETAVADVKKLSKDLDKAQLELANLDATKEGAAERRVELQGQIDNLFLDMDAARDRASELAYRRGVVKGTKKSIKMLQDPILNPQDLTAEEVMEWINSMEETSPEYYAKVEAAAERFFSLARDIVVDKYDRGLITRGQLDALEKYDYSPRLFLQRMIDNQALGAMAASQGAKAGLKQLKSGSTAAMMTNPVAMLKMMVYTHETSYRNNDAAAALYEVVEENPNNGVIKLVEPLKNKDGSFKTDKYGRLEYPAVLGEAGRTAIDALVDGQRYRMSVPIHFYLSWSGGLDTYTLPKLAQIGLGVKTLKKGATGMNPEFALPNLIADILFTNTFTNAFGGNMYSSLKNTLRIVPNSLRMFTANNPVKKINSEVYERALRAGISMDIFMMDAIAPKNRDSYLVNRGTVLQNAAESIGGKAASDIMGHIEESFLFVQENFEMMTRLAIFETNAKRLAKLHPELSQDQIDILAAQKARDHLDYSVGGTASGAMEIIPYNNAALRAVEQSIYFLSPRFGNSVLRSKVPIKTDGTLDNRIVNPEAMVSRIGMMAAGYAAVQMLNNILGEPEDENDQHMLEKIPDHIKDRNLVVLTGNVNSIGEPKYWSLRIPYELMPFIRLSQSMLEGTEFSDRHTSNLLAATQLAFENLPILGQPISSQFVKSDGQVKLETDALRFMFELTGQVPAVSSAIAMGANYDTFTNSKIYYGESNDNPLVEIDHRTRPSFVAMGSALDMSPMRLQVSFDKLFSNTRNNTYLNTMFNQLDRMTADNMIKAGILSPEDVKTAKEYYDRPILVGRLKKVGNAKWQVADMYESYKGSDIQRYIADMQNAKAKVKRLAKAHITEVEKAPKSQRPEIHQKNLKRLYEMVVETAGNNLEMQDAMIEAYESQATVSIGVSLYATAIIKAGTNERIAYLTHLHNKDEALYNKVVTEIVAYEERYGAEVLSETLFERLATLDAIRRGGE